MGNRVEDLESQVAELQATVDGLTEELVETKERLRQLEAASDLDAETRAPERRSAGADDATADDGGDANASDETEEPTHAEYVANPEDSEGGTGAAGGSSTEPNVDSGSGADGEEDDEDDEDIIVA